LAAFAAGGINAVAGGGTVISFPVLLWLGLDPVVANATNQVALWPGFAAGAYGHRRDMSDDAQLLRILILPLLLGGVSGAILLLRTPSAVFRSIAPLLVLTSTCLMAGTEWFRRRTRRNLPRGPERTLVWWASAVFSHFAIAVYAGYFGGGLGILLLTALGLLGLSDLHQMNGIKNVSTLLAQGASVAYLVYQGTVVWDAALTMAAAAVGGAVVATRFAHRVGRRLIRNLAVAVGFGVAVTLLFRQNS
jgi:uncharacterized membrane protein YfcA